LEERIKRGILPAIERDNGILLEGVAVDVESALGGVLAQHRDMGLLQHLGAKCHFESVPGNNDTLDSVPWSRGIGTDTCVACQRGLSRPKMNYYIPEMSLPSE
jgi:hypothetical protein